MTASSSGTQEAVSFTSQKNSTKHKIAARTHMLSFRQIERLFDPLLGLVYPQVCAVCGGSVESHALGVACAECWQRTRVFSADECLCWKCGAPARGISRDKELVSCHRCDDDCFSAARA